MNKTSVGATIGGAAAFVLLAGGLAFASNIHPAAAPTPAATDAAVVQVDRTIAADPIHPTPTPTVVAPPPAPPVEEAPVEESAPSEGAPGDPVPFIPSDDPENANGGDYIDPGLYCQSGSASTVGGQVLCD